MELEKLKALLLEWQKVLRMQDWDFSIKIKRAFDMPIKDVQGCCTYVLASRRVLINLLDPNDYDPAFIDEQDLEKTMVHEMLHPMVAQFEDEKAFNADNMEYASCEQTIDTIAKALVTLKRGAMMGSE